MKIFIKYYYLFLFFTLLAKNVLSYEVETHQKLSNKAVNSSLLNINKKIINDIGMVGIEGYKSNQEILLKYILPQVENGANFEDNGVRSLNHFYDPYNNIGLNSWIGIKSPNWALEDDNLGELDEQEYSLLDASRYLYQALSLGDSKERETNFGKLFRTIGHVIHHVQDMAQPQHVRDDDHCGEVACSQAEFLGVFNPSLYEELSNDSRNNLSYTGYGSVSFPRARDFWHNSNWSGMADFTNQNFISIGTNFIVNDNGNFFTNLNYPEPKPLNEITQPVSIGDVLPETGLTGWMEFIPTMVTDRNLVGTSATFRNDEASTLSIFDQDLQLENACVQYTRKANGLTKTYTYETCRLFTYNRFNVEAAQKYLIPRAVAYSAGLINHFFRGRLDVTKIEQTTDTAGKAVVAITVKNISTQDFAMTNGKLEIFYDAKVDGVEVRKLAQFSEGESGDITELNNGGEKVLNILLPTDIDSDKDNPFVAVYKGFIGEEQGVAGKVFSVKGETAILLFYDQGGNNDLLVKRSVDEGKSWKQITDANLNNFKLYSGSKGTQLLPTGKSRGVLAGRYANSSVTLRTTDNGKTWPVHLEQEYGQYTEILNVVKAVHAGAGRLVTYNNIFSGSFTIGIRTYYTYDIELSESFDDGETWSPLSLPFDVNGAGSQLYYLGNQHFYLLTSGYDQTCNCVKKTWYESMNSGESFEKAQFDYSDLEWGSDWYRDAFAFDTEQIITTKNISPDRTALDYVFAVSEDGGKTLTTKDKSAKNSGWPQAEPVHIRPLGQGKFVSYVFDPWTAYEKDILNHYEGILISEDKGETWNEVYKGNLPTWDYPYYLMMGVVSDDDNTLKYIH